MVRLSGFMMMSMVSFMAASLAEMMFIGRVGTNELAAISFTFPVVYTLQGVSMGLGVGASSVVARATGLGETERVRRLVTHCLILGTAVSILLAVVTWFVLRDIFVLLGAEGQVLDLIVVYMEIWLIGLPIFTMTFVGTTLLRAIGDAKTPGYLSALGSVLHIMFSPAFIFGFGPIPELGLEGAAIAFILARHLAFTLFVYCLVFRDRMLVADLGDFAKSSRDIMHVGLPAMASNMIMPISMSVMTRLLAGHGVVVVAGFGVASRIESLLVMVIWAVGMSISPLVGQNWGAGAYDRVQIATRLGNTFVVLYGVFAYGVFVAAGDYMVMLLNDDPEVIAMAYAYLLIAPVAVGANGVISISTNSFNALGKPMPALAITILQMLVVNIPLILLGDLLWGYRGIYAGGVVTTVLVSIVAWLWIRRTISTRTGRAQAGSVVGP